METTRNRKFGRPWRRALLRAALAALCGCSAATALGQSPVAGPSPVETWYGLHRVDLRERPAETSRPATPSCPSADGQTGSVEAPARAATGKNNATANPVQAVTPNAVGRGDVQVIYIPVAPLRADALPTAHGSLPGSPVPADLREGTGLRPALQPAGGLPVPAPGQAGASGLQPAAAAMPAPDSHVTASASIAVKTADKPIASNPTQAATPAPKAVTPESTARVEHVVALRGESSPAADLHHMAVVQLLSVIAAILLAPLVLALVFFRMLRRSAGNGGTLFRVEFIGAQGTGVQPVFVTAPAYPASAPAERPRTASATEEPSFLPRDPAEIEQLSKSFDPGPSYEEEALARKQREQEQHGALLKHIFDENLQLQEQLATAGAETE